VDPALTDLANQAHEASPEEAPRSEAASRDRTLDTQSRSPHTYAKAAHSKTTNGTVPAHPSIIASAHLKPSADIDHLYYSAVTELPERTLDYVCHFL
jgi:hypothetical protein